MRTNRAKALYRGLVGSVLEHGRITTTRAKAKAVQPAIDRVIGFGKRGDFNARREVAKILGTDRLTDLVFTKVAPTFSDRNSGYTRIISRRQRLSDAAQEVFLELVNYQPKVKDEAVKEKIEKTVAAKPVAKIPETKVKKSAGMKKVVTRQKSGER